jgi:predicted nucleic-acid-binding Zn-ribbon protein
METEIRETDKGNPTNKIFQIHNKKYTVMHCAFMDE